MRDGQSGLSPAYGACIGACNAVEAEHGLYGASGLTEADYQMQTIVQHVRERFAAIGAHPSGKMVCLILEVYELACFRMLAMADLGQLKGGQLALLGGVQINMPRPMEDFFLPLSFELRREGMKPRNLLPELTKDEAAATVRIFFWPPAYRQSAPSLRRSGSRTRGHSMGHFGDLWKVSRR